VARMVGEALGVDGSIVLRTSLKMAGHGQSSSGLGLVHISLRVLVSTVMNFRVP
jgi:hypothetical protein